MKSSFPRIRHLLAVLPGLVLSLATGPAQAAATDIATAPLLVSSPSSVKANLLFILDDSGSMAFDFMPDDVSTALCRSKGAGINTAANTYSGDFGNGCCQGGNSSNACWTGTAPFGSLRGHPPFLSADFNGMAYNPAIRYLPPVDAAGNDYPTQNSANTSGWTNVKNDAYGIQNTGSINLLTQFPDTEWCTNAFYTDCLRNGNYTLPGRVDGTNYNTFRATSATGSGYITVGAPDAPGTEARTFGPHYYNIIPAEYCDAENLRNCQTTANATFRYPAPVRWCNSNANARAITPAAGSCQAVKTGTYSQARYPTKYYSDGVAGVTEVQAVAAFTQFEIKAPSCALSVTALTANGVNLMASASTSTSNRDTLAASIASRINAASNNYSATTAANGIIRITAPLSAGAITYSVSLTRTPTSCTVTTNATTPKFGGYVAPVEGQDAIPAGFPGSFERVEIISSRTTYPAASTRTDCAAVAAGRCTYAEEMTNFANWWTYYHTRMQAMKSSASRAFAAVGNNRRLGYLSINNATGSDYLNLDTFESTQKTSWFSKLTKAKPSGSTPLRTALSRAGRLYGGKLNGTSLNGSTVKDPMLYSCQRNYTILSTDGFWNEGSTPSQLDGSTDIGNQDGTLVRPMYDGNNASNTLADVAAYYANTDLRTGRTGFSECKSGVSDEDVCGNSADTTQRPDEKQVMKTFTLGLGASGYMQFSSKYLSDTTGDFFAVKQGATPNTAAGVCTWQGSGNCNWPTPVSNTLTTIDDLWHAAVNGGGTYFSASDPSTLYTGLSNALNAIDVQTKAAAAATTSNPNVTSGDNQVFLSNFSSGEWSGELVSQRLDIETGIVDDTNDEWSARDLLNANNSRTIYMFDSGVSGKLKSFSWATLNATEKGYFSLSYITTTGRALSQFCSYGDYCVSATGQAAAAGEKLVDFLRGDRTNEGEVSAPDRYFRARVHRLGDIVNSEATYVKGAAFDYSDAGYSSYKQTVSTRAGMVYVGANDGMLHAFNAATGQEAWAYVPTLSLPKMYRLADKEYATKHEYFVDGTPTVQDVYIGGEWKTLLVAGLGAGGRGYFALDVTNPSAPKALWEFADDNLGLTMGKPEIGKLADGTWAVFFGSGYNNVSPGDGRGRLYVLNASTGALIRSIDSGAGTTGTPAGLAHIRAWVDNSDANNTVQRVYAGDNLGNVWRLDVNNNVGAAGYDAQRLATLMAPDGSAQPVTSRPELGQVGTTAMVYVGTGRYLGLTDLADTQKQTIYAIKDRLDAQDYGNPRTPANKFVVQVLSTGTCPANVSVCTAGASVRVNNDPKPVNLATDGGWYVDLPVTSERVNTDPQLALGTLVVNSNVIESGNVCKVGGSSYANFLDYRTGAPISTANGVASVSLGDAIATRPALIKLPNNKVISVSRLSDNRTVSTPTPIEPSASNTRRLSWRDLIQN